ncbi:hypothetical protein N9544_01440 [Flavobacteriales bacterium]|nr:hypothetical protein [Flavobacteriales bacterium]
MMIKFMLYGLFIGVYLIMTLFGGGQQRPLLSYYDSPEVITFEKDIKPIMKTYCGGIFCHHGKPSAFTKYKVTSLFIENGSFKKEVIDDKTMPKRKKLPLKEYNTIKKWLEEGAIEK